MALNPRPYSLGELSSRAEITEVVIAYARAIDRADEELLRSCFHPDSTHRHAAYEGLSQDFVPVAMGIVGVFAHTHHQLGPVSIDLQGEVAFTETYFTAYHRYGEVPPAGGEPHEDRFMGGRYVDRFERRDGVWKIAHRRGVNEWQWIRPNADRGFYDKPASERGTRDRNDPVYDR